MRGPGPILASVLAAAACWAGLRSVLGTWRPTTRVARRRIAALPSGSVPRGASGASGGRAPSVPRSAGRAVRLDDVPVDTARTTPGAWPDLLRGFGARAARRRAVAMVVAELPDAVDLLRVAARAGATPRHALDALARHTDGLVARAAADALDAADAGRPLADALGRLRQLGEPVDALVEVLVASERDGVALAPGLERVALEARHVRRRRAEEVARALPVRLLFPLVLCTLPAFVVLTVVPLLARSLPTLSP